MAVRPIDGNELVDTLKQIVSDYTSHGMYPSAFPVEYAIEIVEKMPTLTPPNEPLTLDELREMNGEPVWGKSLITDKPGEWFILRVVEMSKTWFIACAGAEQGFGDKDTYGKTWLAYRRPPEGET